MLCKKIYRKCMDAYLQIFYENRTTFSAVYFLIVELWRIGGKNYLQSFSVSFKSKKFFHLFSIFISIISLKVFLFVQKTTILFFGNKNLICLKRWGAILCRAVYECRVRFMKFRLDLSPILEAKINEFQQNMLCKN